MIRLSFRRIARQLSLGLCLVALLGASAAAADPAQTRSIFAKDNLAAWCVVPFDASRRGPAERAEMLKSLGFTKLAYDWRDEHVPTFEQEIQCLQKQDVELFAFWCPGWDSPPYRSMVELIEKYKLHPQIWLIAPAAEAESPEKRVEVNAQALLPYVRDAKRLGCTFALYNHGGWSGEPANMIAMAQWLRQHAETDSVGIVYNFHHGHEHFGQFPGAFAQMLPYLTCVNLNGMTIGGEKILPVGQGQEDRRVLEMIRDSGYRGPIGILDHRPELDAEQSLRENLDGLRKLLSEMGDTQAAQTFGP
ncbi:MAG: sugar phosphate isomerase/epimerase family protein [Pirellulaceae bacterium]